MEKGWIWGEPDGSIVGVAADGTIVTLGQCLITKPSKRPGYPIIPMDISTQRYLETHPNPEGLVR